ncbi:MAG: serine hydrolase [Rhizobacter sp.]|nr:serine hydrolase [Rhizobacter sp.]
MHDLLRHTSGLTYGVFGKSLVKSEYLKAGVEGTNLSNTEFSKRIGTMPLASVPGTVWEYSRSTDGGPFGLSLSKPALSRVERPFDTLRASGKQPVGDKPTPRCMTSRARSGYKFAGPAHPPTGDTHECTARIRIAQEPGLRGRVANACGPRRRLPAGGPLRLG